MFEAKNPNDFINEWVRCVNYGEVDHVVALYHEKATLMPTFSARRISTTENIKQYFVQLAARESLSVKLHDNTLVISAMDRDYYLLNGIYSFEFKIDDVLITFPSRFTFVINLADEKPILHHHSSQMPRTLG